jgi:transposase
MEKLTVKHRSELSSFLQEKDRTLEEIKRAQSILLLGENLPGTTIESLTGLKRSTAVKSRKKYIKHGINALISKRKVKNHLSLLTKKQRLEIANMLHAKTPRDYGWDWDYWTPSILGKLILELYNVKYKSKTSLYLIFKQSKFTYHKPEKIYTKRNQEAIDQWKKENFDLVQKLLSDKETVVLVEDEMIITSQTTTQKIWLPKGSHHFIECSNTRKRRSIYGFLDIKTGIETAFKAEKQTSEITAKILKKVLNMHQGKKIVLFWDNAPWHKGDAMRKLLETCNNLLIINFPPYAPDQNPQEHVWKAGRAQITHNTFISDIDKTVREFLTHLNNSIFKYEFFGFTAF